MSSFASLLQQDIYTVPSFTLESGRTLYEVPVAYKTWGNLNPSKDNVMIICHAFTGSADVEDWWGPLMGRGKAFDPNRFFIFCANVMGSPYGSASPVTMNPETGTPYGPEFPATTIRDDDSQTGFGLFRSVICRSRHRRVYGWHGSLGVAVVLASRICSPHRAYCDVRQTFGLVYQLG